MIIKNKYKEEKNEIYAWLQLRNRKPQQDLSGSDRTQLLAVSVCESVCVRVCTQSKPNQ